MFLSKVGKKDSRKKACQKKGGETSTKGSRILGTENRINQQSNCFPQSIVGQNWKKQFQPVMNLHNHINCCGT